MDSTKQGNISKNKTRKIDNKTKKEGDLPPPENKDEKIRNYKKPWRELFKKKIIN